VVTTKKFALIISTFLSTHLTTLSITTGSAADNNILLVGGWGAAVWALDHVSFQRYDISPALVLIAMHRLGILSTSWRTLLCEPPPHYKSNIIIMNHNFQRIFLKISWNTAMTACPCVLCPFDRRHNILLPLRPSDSLSDPPPKRSSARLPHQTSTAGKYGTYCTSVHPVRLRRGTWCATASADLVTFLFYNRL
jgi:hypothetical protein